MTVDCATLGLFILDTFEWRTVGTDGAVSSTKREEGVLGGGGLYAMIGSRVWLPANRVGILVDRGNDWPKEIEEELVKYGEVMWVFRDKPDEPTTRALNLYTGEHRGACDFASSPAERLSFFAWKDLPPLLPSRVDTD